MRDAHEELERRGVRLVVVGNGRPHHAKAFQRDQQITFDLWVAPDMEAYRAAGLRRGAAATLSPRTVGHAWRAMRGGHRQTRVQGDPWQQGGAFLITPSGDVLYEQISREAGDHAPIQDILAAADRL